MSALSRSVSNFAVWNFRASRPSDASELMLSIDASPFIRSAFANMPRLEGIGDVRAGSAVCSIFSDAFWKCKNIQSISFANLPLLDSIGDNSFCGYLYLSNVHLANLPSLRSVGEDAFGDCESLRSISFDNLQLLEIRRRAFERCVRLSSA